MAAIQERVLELALENLMGEKSRVDAEIADIRAQWRGNHRPNGRTDRAPAARVRVTKKAQSTKARQKQPNVASSMKKLWANARKAGFSNLKDYKASLGKR